MIVLSGALVLVALVLLVFGAVDRNLPYVYASIGVSVLSLLLLLVGILQRRGDLTGDDGDAATTPVTDISAERVPALVGAGRESSSGGEQPRPEQPRTEQSEVTAELATPVEAPASRRVVAEPPADRSEDDGPEEGQDDEPDDADLEADGAFEDDEPERHEPERDELEDDEVEGSGVTVLVVSGRPRYHLEGCRVLRGKEPQPLDRDDARTHGFSPCGVCKPDADESAPQDDAPAGREGASFTEALFGEPIFADASTADAGTSALPDRPVQPVLPEVEPAAAEQRTGRPEEPEDAVEPPAPLRGEDPADDPTAVPSPDERADAPVSSDEESVPAAVGDDEPVVEERQPEPVAGAPDVADLDVAEPDVEPAVAQPVGEAVDAEPVDAEPVVEPVAPEDIPVAEAPPVEAEPSSEPAAVRRRRPSARTAAEVADTVGSVEQDQAPGVTDEAAAREPVKTPAKRAPAKKAATKTPAKKASATKASATKAPATKAPAKQAAQAPAALEPQVRRPMVRTVRADALRLGAPATGVTTTRVSARAAAPTTGASVVVVPDRDRFHRPQCRFVRDVAGATTLPKASATRQGYAACGVCKP